MSLRGMAVQADPAVWSRVPDSVDEAEAWVATQIDRVPPALGRRVEDAARLALHARIGSELTLALLLTVPESEIFGMLGILGLQDAPAPATAEGAREVAEALVPSPWAPEVIPVELGAARGWRITVLDPTTTDVEAVGLPQTVSTVYVLDLADRCVVAALTPLVPVAAASAQMMAERALVTLALTNEDHE